MRRVSLLLTPTALLLPLSVLAWLTQPLSAQTTVPVWHSGEWQDLVVSEQFLVIAPLASPTPVLEAAGFFGFELVDHVDCDYQLGLFERPVASGTPLLYSTVDVIETLGVGMGQGYFWSPVFGDPNDPDTSWISPSPHTYIRFTPETTDAEARGIIHTTGVGTVVYTDPADNRYVVISSVASGLAVNQRVAPLVEHPQVVHVEVDWMPAGACPSGGGGGSPWPPTVGSPAEIPTLSQVSLALLTLTLAVAAISLLSHRLGHRNRRAGPA